MSEKNDPSTQASDAEDLKVYVIDQLNQDLGQATLKLTLMLEDLRGSAKPDPDQSRIVSDNLSPLAAHGQPTDKIYFPLADAYYKNVSHSKRLWFWLRGSKTIEWIPRTTSFRIRPFAARCQIILIPDVPDCTLGQQITYILILRATYSNSWADLTKIYNKIWNDWDWVLVEFAPQRPECWSKWLGMRPYPEVSKDEVRDMWRHQTIYKRDPDSMRIALENLRSKTGFRCRYPDYDGYITAFHATFENLMTYIEQKAQVVEVELKTLGEGDMEGTHDAKVDEQKAENDHLGVEHTEVQLQNMTNMGIGAHNADVEPNQVKDTKPGSQDADAEPKEMEDGQPSVNDTDSEPTIVGDTEPSSHSSDTELVVAKDFEAGSQNAGIGSKKMQDNKSGAHDTIEGAEQVDDSGWITHGTDADYAQDEYTPPAVHDRSADSAKVEFMPPLPLDSDADFPQVRGMRIVNFMLDNSDYD
ncbi:hypothetical protein JMJ35_010273 [Cladonia borealis]|uniref:Uncharacterized protein n=1 Tax=Cladonia borealis TaxID=184061 RepID=A0AA39QQF5_9LECA|nr:hypothetical protein JMJ35_010273 [Cladonia borealis]